MAFVTFAGILALTVVVAAAGFMLSAIHKHLGRYQPAL